MTLVLMLALVCGGPDDQVDMAEVARQGDLVQRVDGTWQSDHQQAVVEAMGPPASDADKWQVYVITERSCVPCANLKADWSRGDGALATIAVVNDPDKSWAHLNFYDYQDQSQSFRWEKIKILGFPTIIAQPPRSGKYGDPATVVFQATGYDRNQAHLRDSILAAMKQYVGKFNGANQDAEGTLPFDPPPLNPGTPHKPGVQTPSQQVPPLEVLTSPSQWPGWLWGLLGVALASLGMHFGPTLLHGYQSKRAAQKAKDEALEKLMQKLLKDGE